MLSIFKLAGSAMDGSRREARARLAAVRRVAALEETVAALDDDGLPRLTSELRARVAAGEKVSGEIRDLAFALVREAARRSLGQRHYDVQILGGLVLSECRIAEMRTGEGKTLVAALPTYLSALEGKGVHVVTVNDYLARRDAEIVGAVHRALGLTVGVVAQGMEDHERRAAYACDVTYVTNSELGFDFLRDNMRFDPSQLVQRGHHHAIVDEVDSILIDEARTPLIISGPAELVPGLYEAVDAAVSNLSAEHFVLDEKQRTAILTEVGTTRAEELLQEAGLIVEGGLYDGPNGHLVHHLNQALKARLMFRVEKDYIVRDGEVVIVDEFTGRMMAGRRFSDGLHQALEAKEGVAVQPESQTLSSITYQNLFRMYERLSGMTGTASTEADEFTQTYGLTVVTVPTNRPISRVDEDDEIHVTAQSKWDAISLVVTEAHRRGQPVLIGTSSIEKSEVMARNLLRAGFRHTGTAGSGPMTFNVLNARNHEHEAHIVALAGMPGAVTIATNMAGRGTDIQLGGNLDERLAFALAEAPEGTDPETVRARVAAEVAEAKALAVAAGGLLVIGTERHESRRIDNQLRGRSGRQGDPGRSRFYVSLDDDMARIFGPDRMRKILPSIGLKEGEAISHPWISKALERAQKKVESSHHDTRRNLLRYDDVNNEQRKAVYAFRSDLTSGAAIDDVVDGFREQVIERAVLRNLPPNTYPEQWDSAGLQAAVSEGLAIDVDAAAWFAEEGVDDETVSRRLLEASDHVNMYIEGLLGAETVAMARKAILLQTFDGLWREHLAGLEHLRSVVGFRSYAQRDPFVEYKTDAYEMFEAMMVELAARVTASTMRVRPAAPIENEAA